MEIWFRKMMNSTCPTIFHFGQILFHCVPCTLYIVYWTYIHRLSTPSINKHMETFMHIEYSVLITSRKKEINKKYTYSDNTQLSPKWDCGFIVLTARDQQQIPRITKGVTLSWNTQICRWWKMSQNEPTYIPPSGKAR